MHLIIDSANSNPKRSAFFDNRAIKLETRQVFAATSLKSASRLLPIG